MNSCQFAGVGTSDLRFERARAYQLVNDYAPERDHTLNNLAGAFVYVNTLDQPAGRLAHFRSSRLVSSAGCKVRFNYYMNGASDPGLLTFMVRNQSAGATTYLWSTSKVLGDYWERQELLLPTGFLLELLIEVKTLGGGGIIGLDDISFSSPCNKSNIPLPYGTTTRPTGTTVTPPACAFTCDDGTCIGKEKRCNFAPDCSKGEDEVNCGDCDFEKSPCGWEDDSIGYYVWARRNASSILLMPGDMTTSRFLLI
ncbi:unnamed protein product [Rotaria magnacalcarata]|uniref:MAM domain-containing protein n=2 Tax=Rotaria magnacalcarata TaxID=392030 RepID=A0A8S3FHC3_9BILA|nr:unnamed protein product [Rotaria magnacalcarata]CAF5203531.1 unnamed protein product [Rotaria magnacalcarata]